MLVIGSYQVDAYNQSFPAFIEVEDKSGEIETIVVRVNRTVFNLVHVNSGSKVTIKRSLRNRKVKVNRSNQALYPHAQPGQTISIKEWKWNDSRTGSCSELEALRSIAGMLFHDNVDAARVYVDAVCKGIL